MTGKDRNGSHLISDALWEQIESLLLPENPESKGDPSRMDRRKVMEAILYVLHTGCKWEELPPGLGSGDTIRRHFQEWRRTGAFDRMWQAGILTYDELQALIWQGKNYKAP